jgi:hypothetical protein
MFRFKDGKGDPQGFVNFLSTNNLPKGLISRYREQATYFFHLAFIYVRYHALFKDFLTNCTVSCGGLQKSLATDFSNDETKKQLEVLAIVGKMLTGPWMREFYTILL